MTLFWIRQPFLRYDIKDQATEEKIDKLDFIKSFCASKETIKEVKGPIASKQ